MVRAKEYIIGIDVGGTKIRSILFDGENVIADYELATPTDNINHFMIMLKAVVEPLQERAKADKVRIKGVGLGIAGSLDSEKKKMLVSPNISVINEVRVAEKLQNMIGLPVVMDNDANCFALAEATRGAGRDFSNIYGIIIGTGIGGAWCVDGRVYQGSHGAAGEPGEMIIDFYDGKPIGLEEVYHQLTQNNPLKMAQEAYRADPLAEKAFSEVGKYLGVAFSNIVNILDPEIFILGGGTSDSSDLFLPTIKKTMREHIASSEAAKKVKVVVGKLGRDAGAIGAAMLVI